MPSKTSRGYLSSRRGGKWNVRGESEGNSRPGSSEKVYSAGKAVSAGEGKRSKREVIGRIEEAHKALSAGIKRFAASSLAQQSGISRVRSSFYPKEVFDNKAEYDASVADVVARIKNGTVQARQPDE